MRHTDDEESESMSMNQLFHRFPTLLSLWCMLSAFGTYACMYGFRKPFTAATFEGTVHGDQLKLWLVSAQIAGYMLSKLIGIKVVSEMTRERRAFTLIGLIAVSELALVFFAITPAPYNAVWMFTNGLPLGMIFGIVLGFLEGRKMSEVFIAVLCASFILADGFTKSVGTWLLDCGISDFWMPATAGGIFFFPLLLFVVMLGSVPPPTAVDCEHRNERHPMTGKERKIMLLKYAPLLGGITLTYLLVTVMRSMRADFAPEIWKNLGVHVDKGIFTRSELYVGIVVTSLAVPLSLIRNNRTAMLFSLGLCLIGLICCLCSFALFHNNDLSPFAFMVMLGIGMYVPYVMVHTSIFERFVAYTKERGNIGFLMSVADSAGYIGYCALLMLKEPLRKFAEEANHGQKFLDFFTTISITVLSFATIFMMLSLIAALRIKPIKS